MKSVHVVLSSFIFVAGVIGTNPLKSQTIDFKQHFKMPTVMPASPDAAAIEKFGNIPVSYSTGIPNISVPLWDIKCGSISWPVSISYHAGGIRVDEVASGIGLGWALNAPGVITRNLVGRPDEEAIAEPTYSSVDAQDYVFLYDALNGSVDTEQDIFNYSFNGKNGKFIVNQDGSIMQISKSNLKISFTTGFASFTITDESGIVYIFDQMEIASLVVSQSTIVYASSWYLRKVEMPDKNNVIQFQYGYAGASVQISKSFTQAVGQKFEVSGIPPSTIIALIDRNQRSNSQTSVTTDALKLTKISFPNGTIVFSYDATVRTDVPMYNRLTGVTVNRVLQGDSVAVKRFNLYHSYFFHNPGNDPIPGANHRRLRLDSLAELESASDINPKKHKFAYNAVPIVPRENYGQDIWGYNNGVWNNPSLLQSQNVTFSNQSSTLSYSIGDANRSVDTSLMKACMLTSITYPTGGSSEFTFEPHAYYTDQPLTTVSEFQAVIAGNQSPQVATTTFTFPSTSAHNEYPRVIVEFSKCDFVGVTQLSAVSIKDLITGSTFYVEGHPSPYEPVYWDRPLVLQPGRNYELKAYVYTSVSNAQLTASIKIKWNNYASAPGVNYGGGLRIKEIKNYTNSNVLAGSDLYVYDTAITLTQFSHIQRTYSDVWYRLGVGTGGLDCTFYPSPLCRVYYSNSVYPLSTAGGAPLAYRRVQKLSVDGTGAANGKSEYSYDVFRDELYPGGGPYLLIPTVSNDWRNGFVSSETHYRVQEGTFYPVQKTENKYAEYYANQGYSLRVQPNYVREGCSPNQDPASIENDADWFLYPIRSGSKRLVQQIVTTYDNAQNKLETTTSTFYQSNKYDFATKLVTLDSKGVQDSVTFKYSPDFAGAGNVYEKMEQRNIIAPVIEQKSYSGATKLNTIRNNYKDWFNDGKVIAPDSIQASTLNNALETRLKYYNYDSHNNLTSLGKSRDIKVSYVWGYNNTHPIAEVTNADEVHIAYTSFESGEAGGWSGITLPGFVVNGGITGKKAYTQTGFSFSKAGLSTSAVYTVTYWSKNGAYAVNGTTAINVKTANGFTLFEHKIVNPAGGTITVSGTGTIDELRLYPAVAHMKTYTYESLKGVSSECDANSRIIYYFYDGLSRLILVKDENNEILKRVCYNYAGQPEACNLYGNQSQTGVFQKSCTTGSGSMHSYTVPANTYYASSQTLANDLALFDRNTNGQSYANAYGTCVPAQITVNIQSSVSVAYSIDLVNTSTSQSYPVNLNPSSSTSISIPAGTYNVTISPTSPPASVNFLVNGFSQYSTSASFSGIYMGSGSNIQISY